LNKRSITVDLSGWPERSRLIVRREPPHPGAQLSFTDYDGYPFQAILTDQDDKDITVLECRHRQRDHVEERIRDDKPRTPACPSLRPKSSPSTRFGFRSSCSGTT
jgi:hypothetical protein